MRSDFLPFSRPSITQAEISAVCEVLRSGWISSGPRVEAFETEFARYTGARHALAVTSATAAFQILLRAIGIGPGDDVVTPSLTWPSAVNIVELLGARPRFADIEPGTLQLSPSSVEAAWTGRTKAVIPVHFAGQPCDLDALGAICRARGAVLIEDAAHAAGTEHRGRRVGGGDNPAVFSFHAIKNLTTGEGGMITTGEAALRDRIVSLRFHGVTTDAWRRQGDGAKPTYDLLEPGFKQNLTDIQAALGSAQLRRIEEMRSRREELAMLYEELLAGVGEVALPARVPYPMRHSWHLFQILVDRGRAGLSRDELRAELKRRNVGTGLHFLAVHELTYYRERYPARDVSLEETERVARSTVSLPLFPDMTDGDVRSVVDAIKDVLRRGS